MCLGWAGLVASCLCAPTLASAAERPQLVLQSGHTGHIEAVAFHPDGARLASVAGDSTLRLWDVQAGQELRTLAGHRQPAPAVAFDASGSRVLTGSWDQTARLWDPATGRSIQTFTGHTDCVVAVALGPDGQRAATGSWDNTVRLHDTASGRLVAAAGGFDGWVRLLTFSADGRWLAASDGAGHIAILDGRSGKRLAWQAPPPDERPKPAALRFAPDGKELWTFGAAGWRRLAVPTFASRPVPAMAAPPSGPYGVEAAFSSDARWLAFARSKGTIVLHDTRSGASPAALTGLDDEVTGLAFSRDGRQLAACTRKRIAVWDLHSGEWIADLGPHTETVLNAAIADDGGLIAVAQYDDFVRIWDARQGREVRRIAGGGKLAFGPGGAWLAMGAGRKGRFVDPRSGKDVGQLPGGLPASAVQWTDPAGRWLIADRGKGLSLWDARAAAPGPVRPTAALATKGLVAIDSAAERAIVVGRNTLEALDMRGGPAVALPETCTACTWVVAMQPGGPLVASKLQEARAAVFDARTGAVQWRMEAHADDLGGLAWSSDGKLLVSSGYDKSVRLWQGATGKPLATWTGHRGWIQPVAFGPRDAVVLSGSGDGTVRLWDVAGKGELCSLMSLDTKDWAVVDPVGRFDASPGGSKRMQWLVGSEFVAFEQLKQRYYDPGLLAKVLGLRTDAPREVPVLGDVGLFPSVEFLGPIDDRGRLKVRVTDRGGGIGRIQVFLNGKELLADARGPAFVVRKDGSGTVEVALQGLAARRGAPNPVRIVAWNRDGYLSSRGVVALWTPDDLAPPTPPSLYGIVIGVSQYASPRLELGFAAKDAADFARALELGGQRLFGADRTHVTLLTTDAESKDGHPTKANIAKAFAAARTARPEDVLVVYLAGHGAAHRDVYAYATRDAHSLEFADPAVRATAAVTSDELIEWIRAVPAVHQALVLDTCAAGAAAKKMVEKRDVPSDQIRAIETLKDRTGFFVLMGAAADAVSYEASQYGQGLLTYALLQGLRGAALPDTGSIDVARLFGYAADRVPELARHVGGIQTPLVASPGGASFPIGQLLTEDRKAIPLANEKPLVLAPALTNRDADWDDLELGNLLRGRLRDLGGPRGRGTGPDLVFVDAAEMVGAVRPQGAYTVAGDKVNLRVHLIRDKVSVGTVAVEGSKADLAGLAEKAAAAVVAGLVRR
ncbi:MAG: caspase family protein [Deltaproteobacteria bacterium]|nr:caspase family protein [Deltaproteobacteria bacterium]